MTGAVLGDAPTFFPVAWTEESGREGDDDLVIVSFVWQGRGPFQCDPMTKSRARSMEKCVRGSCAVGAGCTAYLDYTEPKGVWRIPLAEMENFRVTPAR